MKIGAWLERFRRQAGVPAVPADELGPELIPVFTALDDVERAATELRAETERLVAERIERARAEADRIRAGWERRAEEERLRAESERAAELAAEAHAIEAAGKDEAARLRAEGARRIDALVATVVAAIAERRP